MANGDVLHVVLFPWLALGHLIPFARLAIYLAQKGLKVSFISTQRNISRIPKIPPHLCSAVNLIGIPLPPVDGLPAAAEASSDVPYNQQQLLKKAFDSLQSPLTDLLRDLDPDWIIYDYASHWLPPLAAELHIAPVFFCLFTAAFLAYLGPPSALTDGGYRTTVEDFTAVPEWMPPGSNIAFRYHEIKKSLDGAIGNKSGTSDMIRFGVSIEESVAVAVRSSPDLEPESFDLLAKIYNKPVIPLGFLPPLMEAEEELSEDTSKWLNEQKSNSVLYVSFGTEAFLSQTDVTELAFGLEQSETPFLWILRRTSHWNESEMLPAGFRERVGGRGFVHDGWISQVKALSHESVGGCLTHCGWNSIIEGLGFGRVMILFPVVNDQGLNARLLEEKKLGIEIERNERDGSFTRQSVSESVRSAMAGSSRTGETLKERVMEMKGLFGSGDKNERHLDEFVDFLEVNRKTV